jgi:Bacterial Ig-like domain
MDAAAFTPCASPFTAALLIDGAHVFEAVAVDSSGNIGQAASRAFTVHTGIPLTTIAGGPPSLTNDPTPTFTFAADEPASFQCRMDATAFANCNSPNTTAALADGAHTFEVRAIDTAGNVGVAASRAFTVHTGRPVTTVDSGPSGTTADATPTFAFSADEPASFECRVDDAAFAACTSPYTTSALAAGDHSFEVRATDLARNLGVAAGRTFTVAKPVKATLALVSRTVTVTRTRIAAVKLRCGPFARCHGLLTLTASLNGRRTQQKLGNSNFSLASGRTVSVTVKLTTASVKLLVRMKRLPARARITYKQPAGGTTTATRTLTLIAPKQPTRR